MNTMNRITCAALLAALTTVTACDRFSKADHNAESTPKAATNEPAPAPVAIVPPAQPAPVTPAVPVAPTAPVVPPPAPVVITTTTAPAPVSHSVPVDAALPDYKPQTQLEGRMRSVGSDTLDEVMLKWQAAFKGFHPKLEPNHEGKGSGTAVPALLDRVSDFGPMSRSLNESESKTFYARKNYPLLQIRIAVDALALFVHPTNPIAKTGLDFKQVDAIFSSTHTRGGTDITTWGQLGLTGEWAAKPIDVYSRNKASGTYAFFREHVLKKGDFKPTNHEMIGSAVVIQSIEQDPFAIGYSGIGYKTDGVVTVPLTSEPGGKMIPAASETAYSGEYPLSRYLYIAIDQKKGEAVDPLKLEFIRFVYSKQGQQIVADAGFFPIPAATAREELLKLGIEPGF